MLTLLVETCTERAIVAIIENDHCSYMSGLPFGLHNTRFLVPKVDEGFQAIGKTPQDLDLVAVGVGPGSYTGMRVGAIVAKSISYTTKIPLVGVCTLEGFTPDCNCTFAAIVDAKMAGAYLLKGECASGIVHYISTPQVCTLEELPKHLADVEVLVSPHCAALRGKIEKMYPDANWSWQETAPDPIHLVQRAKEKFEKGEYSTDGSVEILYMRE